jgi:AcrR family transcriptional regulator
VPQQERARATRAAILHAAAEVFDERGYGSTSLDVVADTAGVTKGALYFHFPSKAALADAVIAEQHRLARAYADRVSAVAGSCAEAIVLSCASLATQLTREVTITAGIRLTTEVPDRALTVAPPYLDWLDQMGRLIRGAVDEGAFRADLDVDAATHLLVGAYTGVQTLSGATTGRADVFERLAQLLSVLLPWMAAPGSVGLTTSLVALVRPTDLPSAP